MVRAKSLWSQGRVSVGIFWLSYLVFLFLHLVFLFLYFVFLFIHLISIFWIPVSKFVFFYRYISVLDGGMDAVLVVQRVTKAKDEGELFTLER